MIYQRIVCDRDSSKESSQKQAQREGEVRGREGGLREPLRQTFQIPLRRAAEYNDPQDRPL